MTRRGTRPRKEKVFWQRNIFLSGEKTQHAILTCRHFMQIYIYEEDTGHLLLFFIEKFLLGYACLFPRVNHVPISLFFLFSRDIHPTNGTTRREKNSKRTVEFSDCGIIGYADGTEEETGNGGRKRISSEQDFNPQLL